MPSNKISVNGFENQAAAPQQAQVEIGSIFDAVTLTRPPIWDSYRGDRIWYMCVLSNKEHY